MQECHMTEELLDRILLSEKTIAQESVETTIGPTHALISLERLNN